MKNWCFSKKLLAADYSVMLLLIIIMTVFAVFGIDAVYISAFSGVWAVQLGVSSGFYYSKAKAENTIKLPVQLLKTIPKDMRDRVDPTSIITAVFGIAGGKE